MRTHHFLRNNRNHVVYILAVYPLLVTLASFVLWTDEPSPKDAYFVTAEVILSAIVGYVGVFLGHIRFTVFGKPAEKF